ASCTYMTLSYPLSLHDALPISDLCTAFVGSAPDVPVWEGELSCRALGAAVEAFDETGAPVIDQVGELVITKPMPSMPVSFYNDRSEEHTSELQSRFDLVCRLLL